MPDIQLDPKDYRSDRPRVISRRTAGWQLGAAIFTFGLGWWLVASNPSWWAPGALLIPGMLIGALVTRLWPLFFLEDEGK